MANYGAWRVTYTEGQWVVLSGPSSMVVMEPAPATASELLDEVWGAVLGAASITALATRLTAFGLDRMPAMAVLFSTEHGLKALLRGPVELRDGDTGELIASGEGAHTWHEVAAPTPRVFLHLDDVDPNALLQLPLVVGAARASAVLIDTAAPVAVGTTQFIAGRPDPQPEPAAPAPATPVVEPVLDVAAPATPSAEASDPVALYDKVDPGEVPAPDALVSRPTPDPAEDHTGDEIVEETPEPEAREPEPTANPLEEIPPADAVTPAAAIVPEPAEIMTPAPEPEPEPVVEIREPEPVADEPVADAVEPHGVVEDPLEEPSWLHEDSNPESPVLVSLHEPQFDEEPISSRPAEPTQVLDGRPPYAPGQAPESADHADPLGIQFGNTATGTTGPFGAEGFGALIASVAPTPAPRSEPVAAPVPSEPVAPIPATSPVDPIETEPAIPAGTSVPAPGPKVIGLGSDHDGATIFATGIAATHKPAAVAQPDTTVMASVCALGHPNRPGTRTCRICGGIVDAHTSQLVNRPVLAAVVSSVGDQVPLSTPVIVGRAPARPDGEPEAELLRVPSPGHDISRNHARISTRDWTVEVTDLHSTNGTVVLTSDGQTFRLAPGQTVTVGIGDRIDLGDGQVLTITEP